MDKFTFSDNVPEEIQDFLEGCATGEIDPLDYGHYEVGPDGRRVFVLDKSVGKEEE